MLESVKTASDREVGHRSDLKWSFLHRDNEKWKNKQCTMWLEKLWQHPHNMVFHLNELIWWLWLWESLSLSVNKARFRFVEFEAARITVRRFLSTPIYSHKFYMTKAELTEFVSGGYIWLLKNPSIHRLEKLKGEWRNPCSCWSCRRNSTVPFSSVLWIPPVVQRQACQVNWWS